MARLDQLLRQLKEAGGSDLHLAAGLVPRMRRRGHIEELAGEGVLDDAALRALLAELTGEAQWQEYETARDLDFAYAIPGVARFRRSSSRAANADEFRRFVDAFVCALG